MSVLTFEFDDDNDNVESIDANLDAQLAIDADEIAKNVPIETIVISYGLCKACESGIANDELANGLCVDCWDAMVDVMPDYTAENPSLSLWYKYFGA